MTGSRAIANTRRDAQHQPPPPGPVKPVAKTPEAAKAGPLNAIRVRALCNATHNQPAGLAPNTCSGNTRKQ